jgi:hypothetical protein
MNSEAAPLCRLSQRGLIKRAIGWVPIDKRSPLALPRHLLFQIKLARAGPEGLCQKQTAVLWLFLICSIKEALMKLSLLLALHRFTP